MRDRLDATKIKAALFDVDGTLIDSLPMLLRGLGDTFEHFTGKRPSESDLRGTIGVPLLKQMSIFGCDLSQPGAVAEIEDYTISRYRFHRDKETQFDDAVTALLACQKAGWRVAAVTSRNADEVAFLKESHDWANGIELIISASDVANPKPHPEPALKALDAFGIQPHEAIFVGDSIFDLQCAKGANIPFAAVLYGAGNREDLLAGQPELVFTTPADLLDWISQTQLEQKNHGTEEERDRSHQFIDVPN